MKSVFRFAPSPNGHLHLGHALSALLNSDMARAAGGVMLLRIEDIDDARCKPEYEAAIYEDLRWLGVTWTEPVRRQSDHHADYRAAIAKLDAMGLIYPAFESRTEIARFVAEREEKSGEIWPRDPDGGPRYPGTSKSLSAKERQRLIDAGAPYALRFDVTKAIARLPFSVTSAPMHEGGADSVVQTSTPHPDPPPQGRRETSAASLKNLNWTEFADTMKADVKRVAADPSQWGDVILARKDTPNSYHLSVVVDDALQGVTHVVRGQDLYFATSMHRLLQELLGLPAPIYHHHRLILDRDGRKLSKSTRSTALRELRAGGAAPADIRRLVGLPGS